MEGYFRPLIALNMFFTAVKLIYAKLTEILYLVNILQQFLGQTGMWYSHKYIQEQKTSESSNRISNKNAFHGCFLRVFEIN